MGEFVRQTRLGDSVTLFTYDSDTSPHPTVRITDETDKRDLLRELDQFRAEGNRTHTGKAIHDALERAAELGNRADTSNRTVSIVLFTDGIEDVRGLKDPVSIPSNIQMLPQKRPFIFFISLGEREHEQQLDEFVRNPAMDGRGEVVRDPGAQRLSVLNERIRVRIAAADPLRINVAPSQLYFGQLEPGETTQAQTLKVQANSTATASVSLVDSLNEEVTLIEPSGSVQLQQGETVVPVKLQLAPGLADGTYLWKVMVAAQKSDAEPTRHEVTFEARLEVAHVPLWRKSLKWLAILLALLVLAVVGFSIYKGDFPWRLWNNWAERKHLEGEIEIIRPAPTTPESGFVGLRGLRRDRAALHEVLHGIGTTDADAEILTSYKNGRKLISLNRITGVVRVNGAEVVTTNLYDGDVIEFGDTRLRFNWVGHERPVDSDDNY